MSEAYPAFKSIPRLFRDMVITEKLDGTNALVSVGDDGTVRAGSRNRWLTPESDNFGFAKWVRANEESLRALGPGLHYGEWWGLGIQRGYGLTEKRFSLFNVGRWTSAHNVNVALPGDEGSHVCIEVPVCYVVPVLMRGAFDSGEVKAVMDDLMDLGSYAATGFMQPEGVVVFHPKSGALFKVTDGGDGHKGAR